MWVVENVNGDGSLVKKGFETYQEAKAYAEWTLGAVRYAEKSLMEEYEWEAEQKRFAI